MKFTDIKPEFEVPADEYDDFEIHKTPDPVTVPQGDDIPSVSDNGENTETEDVVSDDIPVDDVRIHSRYPKTRCELPKYLRDYDDSTKCNIDYCCRLSAIPQTYQEAISSPEAAKWQEAMEDEMQSLAENDTFTVVPLPDDRKSVGGDVGYTL